MFINFPMATTSRGRKRAHPTEEEEEEDFVEALIKKLKKLNFVYDSPEEEGGGLAFYRHGKTLRDNVIAFWRQHFVRRENMREAYFEPDDNETIHPEAAEPEFTDLEYLYQLGAITELPHAEAQVSVLSYGISPQHFLENDDNSAFGSIEHFMDSQDSSHPKFSEVSGLEFPICSRDGVTTLSQGIANNQTLAYFIGTVYLFLKCLGIDENRVQFRQLPPNEMAPGAADCWLVDIKCSSGWVSCVWITHTSAACACEKAVITPKKEELLRAFKGDHKMVRKALEALDYKKAMDMKYSLEQKGRVEFEVEILQKTLSLTKNMVSVSTETLTASLIKLSFCLGRIISCVYEHSFYLGGEKENQQLCVFRFTPLVAPIKCAIIVMDPSYRESAEYISQKLEAARIVHKLDITGKLKGHVRLYEHGVPFALVVDSTTSVMLCERDSDEKLRFAEPGMEEVEDVDYMDDVVDVVKNLMEGHYTWGELVLNRRNR